MTYVVCEPCHDCKYTDCAVVCPKECFYQDDAMLYIDPDPPDGCIDCDACVDQCPVTAIFPEASVPSEWQSYIELNAERSAALKVAGQQVKEKQDPKEGPECKKA